MIMRYCPHCKKPSARTTGPCPHCGNELAGKPLATDAAKKQKKQRPPSAAQSVPDCRQSPASQTAETKTASSSRASSGLDLESLAPDIPLPETMATSAVELQTEIALGGFEKPGDGILGAFQYWWHVHKRLNILKIDLRNAEKKASLDNETALRLSAEFGRALHQGASPPAELVPLMDAARLADGERKGLERKRNNEFTAHRNRIDALNADIERIERENAPTLAKKQKLTEEKQHLLDEQRGIETRKKRVQIDLRNMETLIRQRTEKNLSPKTTAEEKEELLNEISRFDKRCPELKQQIDGFDKALHKLSMPVSACEMDLNAIDEQLAPDLRRIAELKKEIEQQEAAFTEEDRITQTVLEVEDERATNAWAEVAKQAIFGNSDIADEHKSQKAALTLALRTAHESTRHVELLVDALEGYDKQTVAKAKKQAAVMAGLLILFIIGFVLIL